MDYQAKFADAIRAAGLAPPEQVEADGKLHRFASNGTHGDDAGWYVLHGDGIPSGAFGCWREGVNETWRADIGRKLSPVEAAAHAERVEKMRREREAEEARRQAEARALARKRYDAARPANAGHPYLVRKGVKPHGIRQEGALLLVPMRDGDGLHSLQTIDAEGQKRFLPGGRVAGCYHAFGKPGPIVCIAEGYATGASIHEATSYPVAVAFNAGNLEAVARALRTKLPDARIVVCADDDAATAGNPGLTKASDAARAIGGLVAVPDFGTNRPEGATDFNDMAQHRGAEAVREAVERASVPDVPEAQPATPSAPAADSAGDEWPEPLPIRTELYPVPAFDAAALLPEVLREWVMDEAERMPCAPDFVAAAAIVGLGAAIGARCAVRPKVRDSWLVVPNLWGGVVGLPSAKKSPAIDAAMRPLHRLAAKAQEAHRVEVAGFEATRLLAEARADAMTKRLKVEAIKPNADMEALAAELQQHNAEAPAAPKMRRFVTNDSTVEKLGELLRDNPTGLLVLRDELVGLLASWERERHEGDRAFYLEAWNGTSRFNTDRIGRGEIDIPNLCLSVCGGIQPDKLTRYLEQAADALGNDGMLQRFQIMVYPDARLWEWRDYEPNARARDAVFALFDALATFEPIEWGAQPADAVSRFPAFRFDDAAQAVFVEWATELNTVRIPSEQAEGSPLVAQHLAKYEKAFAALALVLHLAECAATGARGPVSERAAIRAAAWCEYLEAHARRCYGLLADKGARAARALAARIKGGALADGFTAREVVRKGWAHLSDDNPVTAALDWLEAEGWLRAVDCPTSEKGGRPTIRYLVNPKARKVVMQPTDKTDITPVSSVLAVPRPAVFVEGAGAHG